MRSTALRLGEARACGATGAVRQLQEWITSARYTLNSKLPPERELATQLQMSRGQLREALKQLEEEGRIWRRVGMGTFVGSRPRSVRCGPEALGSATTLAEILEARALVEPLVARLSAQRAEHADIAMIEQYSAFASRAQSWAEWEKWDELLHAAIAEASGNGLLINAINQMFRVKLHPRWTVQRAPNFNPALTARYAKEHQAVISCIVARNGEGAEAAMRRHILGVSLTLGPTIAKAGCCRLAVQACSLESTWANLAIGMPILK